MVDRERKTIPEASKQAVMKQTRRGEGVGSGRKGQKGSGNAVLGGGEERREGMKMKTDKRMKKHSDKGMKRGQTAEWHAAHGINVTTQHNSDTQAGREIKMQTR